MDTPKQREELRDMVTKLYQECGMEVQPLYPKILVRVLPREQKLGSVWLPDSKQNKPTWEGIVIKTYKPFMRRVYLEDVDWVADNPEPEVKYSQMVRSDLKPGDHVLFPHIEFGILPVDVLDSGKGDYRLVPEGVMLCTLNYTQKTMLQWLTELIPLSSEDGLADEVASEILLNADVIRKDIAPLTTSGA
jgi:hypothetical protein